MAKTRILIRRDLTQAITSFKHAQTYLVRSGLHFQPNEPRLYDAFADLTASIQLLINATDKLRQEI